MIKKNFQRQKTAVILSISALLLMGMIWRTVSRGPTGGEICLSDFENGVEIYIEEGYSSVFHGFTEVPEPHSIWLTADGEFREEILHLCREIRQYRQIEKSSDILLGMPDGPDGFRYLPRVYLVTEAICYRMEVLNWENYTGSAWSRLPIRQERFGEPTICVSRIDLSLMPEDKTPYGFAKEYFGPDTMNSESGAGWYAVMPQESLDALLCLLLRTGTENAEKIESIR